LNDLTEKVETHNVLEGVCETINLREFGVPPGGGTPKTKT